MYLKIFGTAMIETECSEGGRKRGKGQERGKEERVRVARKNDSRLLVRGDEAVEGVVWSGVEWCNLKRTWGGMEGRQREKRRRRASEATKSKESAESIECNQSAAIHPAR